MANLKVQDVHGIRPKLTRKSVSPTVTRPVSSVNQALRLSVAKISLRILSVESFMLERPASSVSEK
jgi:hypothetical protein